MRYKDRYGQMREGTFQDHSRELDHILKHGFIEKPQPKPSRKNFTLADAQAKIRKEAGIDLIPDLRTPDEMLADKIGEEVGRQVRPVLDELREQQQQIQAQQQIQSPRSSSVEHEAPLSPFMTNEEFKKLYNLQDPFANLPRTKDIQQAQRQSASHGQKRQYVTHSIGPVMSCKLYKF